MQLASLDDENLDAAAMRDKAVAALSAMKS
jgi:hypothetical protein